MLTDGRTTDARVTGILIAHLGAFGSGELKSKKKKKFFFFLLFLIWKNRHGIGIKKWLFLIGNGAKIRPLEKGRKCPEQYDSLT